MSPTPTPAPGILSLSVTSPARIPACNGPGFKITYEELENHFP